MIFIILETLYTNNMTERTPNSHNNDIPVEAISTYCSQDSYDVESGTSIWHIPDMPDHVIERKDGETRFVTLSGRTPEAQDNDRLQTYLRELGARAVSSTYLLAASPSSSPDYF